MKYFGKAGLNGQTAKLTTVKQVREIGSAVLTCEDLSNWATDTPVFFATYKVDIDTQKIVPNSQINWRGKVNVENNTIIEIQADSDTPDKGNAIGDIVECLPTAGWANSLVDGISVIHKQDGTLKNNVVKGQNIDFASIEDGSIERKKLKTPFQIDFAASSSGETITYTPKFDCSVIVEMSAHGWGHAGGLFIGEVSQTSGPTVQTVGTLPFTVEGHDIVRKQLYSKGTFKGLKAGQQYTFSHKLLEGRRGGMGGFKFMITAIAE